MGDGPGYLPWHWEADRRSRPCVADERLELTYGEVADRVEAVAAQLREHGIGPHDVVAVMLPNRIELLLVIMAAWRLGATATPLNPAFTEREATHQLQDSGARILVAAPDAPSGGTPTLDVGDLATTHPDTAELPPPPGDDELRDRVALLIYTSGSTGRPKGVMQDHANVTAMAHQMVRHFGLTADDHCLLVLPLFHVNAILVSAISPFLAGARTTILDGFTPDGFLEALEQVRPTYFSAVPTIYARLAELPADRVPDTSSLRFAICGAAPVSKELLDACEERFGFVMVEGYGLTEGTCASACNPVDGVRKLGTVGPALEGQQLRIVDPDGNDVPTGETGEVLVAGPTVMRGYLNQPEETARTIEDGWLHTGDVGRLDEDGYLTIVDRIKDMIIRGGENLYPKEIEATLYEVEDVLEAAVVGRPDTDLGEVPVAFVVLYPESTTTAQDLVEHCRQNLTRAKVPVDVTIVDELPKNPVGKIDKPTLRERLHPATA